jgi:hypothetical protein
MKVSGLESPARVCHAASLTAGGRSREAGLSADMTSRISYPSHWSRARDVSAGGHTGTVDPEHQAELDALLGLLHTAVALEMRCELSELPAADTCDREYFRAHFATLDRARGEWNAAVDRVHAAPEALWRRFANSARERGITEPPFMVGVLIDQVATSTVERSRQWELDTPREPPLEHFNDRLDGGAYVSVYAMGRRVATLPGGPESDVRRRVEAADSLIRALFAEAQGCSEAREITAAQDALLALKQQLLEQLAARRPGAAFELALGCPRCDGR